MSERRKILEMLAEGSVGPDDAERLLARLEESRQSASNNRQPKFLRVRVDSERGDKVNIAVPLALIRAGIKLQAIMPEGANEKLRRQGVDFSELLKLNGDELIDALRDLTIDVQSANGETVRVYCD